MNETQNQTPFEGDDDTLPSAAKDMVGDLITGIPTPIRKNAAKAFARLCTAAVEFPLSIIQNVISERQAETRARIKLIEISAEQIAQQMRIDVEYARAASNKFAQRVVRERINLDNISQIAADKLKLNSSVNERGASEKEEIISDDWLNAFEREASDLSSDQMQLLFGRILAGEIERPKSFSVRTIKLMGQLDNDAAVLFHRLCSLSVSLRLPDKAEIIDARVVSMGRAAQNSLKKHGLGFSELNTLHEYGLIIADFDSYMDYRPAVVNDGRIILPFTYQNSLWALHPKTSRASNQEFRLEGVRLSRIGRELLPIVDITPVHGYTVEIQKFLDAQGMAMVAFR